MNSLAVVGPKEEWHRASFDPFDRLRAGRLRTLHAVSGKR